MIDFQIRQAIALNVMGESAEEFSNIINDALASGEEHLLPGLGVFLEKWWLQASAEQQKQFTSILAQQFKAH